MTAWRPGRTGRSTRRSSVRPTSPSRRRAALDRPAGRSRWRRWRPRTAPRSTSRRCRSRRWRRWSRPPRRHRDPQRRSPSASTMTSDSAWGAVHWGAPPARPPAPAARRPVPPDALPPAPSAPPAAPRRPGARRAGRRRSSRCRAPPAPSAAERLSRPGHAGLVRARPVRGAADPARPGQARRRSGTPPCPGLCICLAVGGLIYVLAPMMLAVAFGLASRVKVARDQVRRAFASARCCGRWSRSSRR